MHINELKLALKAKISRQPAGVIYNWPIRHKYDRDLLRILSDVTGSPRQLLNLRPNRTRSVLGKTFDFAILNLGKEFYPNDLGIIIETVRGGGFIFLRIPSKDRWTNIRTYTKDKLGFSASEGATKPRFLSWLVETLRACDHGEIVHLQDQDHVPSLVELHVQKKPSESVRNLTTNSLSLRMFPGQLLDEVKTQDQARCLIAADEIISKRDSSINDLLVILANRGRGKSAVLGIIAAGYISWASRVLKETIAVVISSPFLENIQEALKFTKRCLLNLGFEVVAQRGQQATIHSLTFPQGSIQFVPPAFCDSYTPHFLLIDEAGGIPPPLLKSMLRRSHLTVLSATVHGYEGVGRSFNIKFLSRIRKQPEYCVREIFMTEPIRFPEGDFVEKWLFRALLLDTEPIPLSRKIKITRDSELRFVQLDKDQLFSIDSEKTLRSVFGIFIHSHYRNQPNDISIAADAPNYDIFSVCLKDHADCPLTAILSCWEGGFDEQAIETLDRHPDTQGNIIPLSFLRYHDKDFAEYRGVRVVRIATQPDRQAQGFGGYGLEKLSILATQKGADWIGSSFGATTRLVRFWSSYGFRPIHIGPKTNPATGEYSIVVVKGISPGGQRAVERMNADFLLRFSGLLQHIYQELDTELATELLRSCAPIADFTPRLTSSMRLRVWRYCWGQLRPVLALEAIRELALCYFLSPRLVKLSRAQELILVSKILQDQTWGKSMVKTHMTWIHAQGLLKKAIKKLLKNYEQHLANCYDRTL